ncbi:M15 family metallopeptidase [Desulfarculus baarsii]|uniref:M15 family metallopeptidase n=1 Tax=Desulfarculus baarsii TaxID=453230 RepID=UPI003898E5BB
MPRDIVEVFEAHGFVWGGRWRRYDTMHFEAAARGRTPPCCTLTSNIGRKCSRGCVSGAQPALARSSSKACLAWRAWSLRRLATCSILFFRNQ